MESSLAAKPVASSFTIMTEMIMPNDANNLQNLMGGNLLRWMDIGAAICAGKHSEAYVVTASVDHVSFSQPIRLGEVITLECSVTRAFNTSVEVFVEVFAADVRGKYRHKSNQAYLTFVALDPLNLKPIPVPPVTPTNEAEQIRYDGAVRRRQVRLILAGRMKPADADELRALFDMD